MLYIVLAILAFGILIAVHEIGHFTAAKLLGVKVTEFAIGFGPKLLTKQGKETLYSLRALPFGGFCAMEGQDESTVDPRGFTSQKRWRRILILFAGSLANFIAAFIIVIIINSGITYLQGTTITRLVDHFPEVDSYRLMEGDTILSINGERLYYRDDFNMFMQLAGNGPIEIVLQRGGERIKYERYPLERDEYIVDGQMHRRYALSFNTIEVTFFEQIKYSGYQAVNFIRLIRVSLAQMVSGAIGVRELSGPVGIVEAMSDIGQAVAAEFGIVAAIRQLAFFTAFIGVNLAVMNMLPIPALDGGRILLIIVTWFIEKIIRRPLDPKYEGYIHTGAFVLLIGFMVLILINDVVKLFI